MRPDTTTNTEHLEVLDASSIKTLPPIHCPPNETPEELGPGVPIPTGRIEDYDFVERPKSN